MKLLVAGAAELDAGKTTFATGLVAETGATGFKPRAGNDYWYDHSDYRHAVEQGRLYGKDARRLAAASPGDPAPEELNPVHRLWIPTPRAGRGLLGRQDRAFVVDRVTGPRETDEHVVNASVGVPDSAREHLPLDAATKVGSISEFNAVMAQLHKPSLDAVHERIRSASRAVVESYTDIARSLTEFEPDAVAVVEPRRARVYRGNRYAKACEVVRGSATAGRLEEPVDRVLELLDPAAAVELPALGSDERTDPDRVADRYELAYDAVLAAAFANTPGHE